MSTFHMTYVILFGILMDTAQTAPMERQKRYLTPYPVPTKPYIVVTPAAQVVLTGSFLLTSSRPISCPVKRSVRYNRLALNDTLMSELYEHLIGEPNKAMVAGTLDEANAHFVHLTGTHGFMKNKVAHDEAVLKSVFKHDVQKFNKWYSNAIRSVRHNSTKPSTHSSFALKDLLQMVDITMTQLKQILDIKSDILEVSKYRIVKSRKTRDTPPSGLMSYKQYCNHRGQGTGDGYLHLCTTCAWSTQLAPDRYPRVINEATCDKSDCNCFTVNGSPHGKCQPMIQHVKMLRKKSGGCRLLIQNGTRVIIDDWEIYDQPTRVGCECVLNKKSVFAKFIAGNPHGQAVG